MHRKLLYLINPVSGRSDKKNLEKLIRSKTKAAGLEYAFYPTVADGDYAWLVPVIRENGFTDVIIAGGDGTVNQVVNSLRNLDVNFGILPCGSGNGLAFCAHIPKNPEKALDIIFKGKIKQTDGFQVNGRFACMLCGLGLDAQVAHDFANDPRRGLSTYIKKTIANFISAKSYPFLISSGGRQIKTKAYFISIANSNQFGNHFTIAPKASLTDGLLDIVVMTRQSKISALLQVIKQLSGYNRLQQLELLNEHASVLYFQTAELKITNTASAALHIDGEPTATEKELNIRVLERCFRLISP